MSAIEDNIRSLLNQIAREQNYQDYKIQLSPISSGGANYSSFLYVATVSSDSKDDLNLFIKYAALSEKMRKMLTKVVYLTEKFVYSDLKKSFRAIEDKNNVEEKDRLYFAEYYGAVMTPLEEILVLENLVVKGFGSHDRSKSIDWEYASSAVTEIAKYHALSLAYEQEYPDEYKNMENHMVDPFTKDMFPIFMFPGIELSYSGVREEYKDKHKKFCKTITFEMFKKHLEPSRLKVMTHGDFRPSNLMHKNLDDGTVQVIVLDHQTPQQGSPVTDLLYLIFTGTDQQFRTQYYQRLVDHYYTQFDAALKRLGMDSKNVYPRADFDADLKEKLPLGLMLAFYCLPTLTADAEDTPAIGGDKDGGFKLKKVSSLYAERLNGIIDDYVKWGILTD